jgi:hypothetical protein
MAWTQLKQINKEKQKPKLILFSVLKVGINLPTYKLPPDERNFMGGKWNFSSFVFLDPHIIDIDIDMENSIVCC